MRQFSRDFFKIFSQFSSEDAASSIKKRDEKSRQISVAIDLGVSLGNLGNLGLKGLGIRSTKGQLISKGILFAVDTSQHELKKFQKLT